MTVVFLILYQISFPRIGDSLLKISDFPRAESPISKSGTQKIFRIKVLHNNTLVFSFYVPGIILNPGDTKINKT